LGVAGADGAWRTVGQFCRWLLVDHLASRHALSSGGMSDECINIEFCSEKCSEQKVFVLCRTAPRPAPAADQQPIAATLVSSAKTFVVCLLLEHGAV